MELLATGIRAAKERKGRQTGKEEVTMPLFAHDTILYVENPKDATVQLVELIHGFGNVAGHKINAQKSLAFLFTKEEKKKEKLRKDSHLPLQGKE